MTSRQPETEPPRAAGGAQTPGTGERQAQGLLLARLLPLALLIILGLAGLRGAVTKPSWDGPLHRDGVAIGVALEVVLAVLLVITTRRHSAARSAGIAAVMTHGPPVNAVAAKLRGVLIFVLSAGMAAVAVIADAGGDQVLAEPARHPGRALGRCGVPGPAAGRPHPPPLAARR